MRKKIFSPSPYDWQYLDMANCYQFAIGLREDRQSKLMPGELAKDFPQTDYLPLGDLQLSKNHKYTDEELINFVKEDLFCYGYILEEIEKDAPLLSPDEWKITVLNVDRDVYPELYDFHFLAYFNGNDCWYQKFSREQLVERVESPDDHKYDYPYHIVGYFKIRKAGG